MTLIISLVLSKLLQCIINNQCSFQTSLLSFHIKSALSVEIYEKLLHFSISGFNSQAGLSYGKVVNLMQVDLNGITSGIINSIDLLTLPIT